MRFEPNKVPRVEYAVWQILIHWGWSWDYQGGRIQYAREGSDTFMEAWEAVEDSLRDERSAAGASPKPPGPDQTSAAGREAEPPTGWTWEREALDRLLSEGHARLEGDSA